MWDLFSIYGSYKVTSRHDNSGGGGILAWVIGIVVVGYLILKGIVIATGFNDLYSIVGHVILYGFLTILGLLALGWVYLVLSCIKDSVISFVDSVIDKFDRRTYDDEPRLKQINKY